MDIDLLAAICFMPGESLDRRLGERGFVWSAKSLGLSFALSLLGFLLLFLLFALALLELIVGLCHEAYFLSGVWPPYHHNALPCLLQAPSWFRSSTPATA